MKKKDFYDDGRTVADMSALEPHTPFSLSRKGKRERENAPQTEQQFSKEDRRMYIKTALLASMLVAGIFILAGALFILFCQHIWLK